MKLWLIEQNINNGYDTYDSAVVAAKTEEEARNIHPRGDNEWSDYCWVSPNKVSVSLIGNAIPKTNKGVICASFNAG